MSDIVLSENYKVDLTTQHGGIRPKTIGLFVHCTHGPTTSLEADYRSTVNYFKQPATAASAHLVIGPSETTRMVPDQDMAWHAIENNQRFLGVELALPDPAYTGGHPLEYTDYQYRMLAEYARKAAEKYGFPLKRVFSEHEPGIIGHQDSEQGKAWGKTDPGPTFDWAYFLRLAAGVPPTTKEVEMAGYEFRLGFADKARELGSSVVGEPIGPEQYIGQDFSLQPTTKGVMLYSKSANRVYFLSAR